MRCGSIEHGTCISKRRWSSNEKGHKKVNVPDQVVEKRDVELFNRVKGNPTKVAIDKIVGELDYRVMVELENKN